MLLSGNEIELVVNRTKAQKAAGLFDKDSQLCRPSIDIEPFELAHLNPHSYDMRLGKTLRVYEVGMRRHLIWKAVCEEGKPLTEDRNERLMLAGGLDMAKDNPWVEFDIPDDGFWLYPGVVYLGVTLEHTAAFGLAPKVDGRSSVGRLSMFVHLTAAYGDSGFMGPYTLELAVIQPLKIYHGVRVCQITFETIQGHVTDYAGKYGGHGKPQTSRMWKDFPSKEGS